MRGSTKKDRAFQKANVFLTQRKNTERKKGPVLQKDRENRRMASRKEHSLEGRGKKRNFGNRQQFLHLPKPWRKESRGKRGQETEKSGKGGCPSPKKGGDPAHRGGGESEKTSPSTRKEATGGGWLKSLTKRGG